MRVFLFIRKQRNFPLHQQLLHSRVRRLFLLTETIRCFIRILTYSRPFCENLSSEIEFPSWGKIKNTIFREWLVRFRNNIFRGWNLSKTKIRDTLGPEDTSWEDLLHKTSGIENFPQTHSEHVRCGRIQSVLWRNLAKNFDFRHRICEENRDMSLM